MTRRLADFFSRSEIRADGVFNDLGHADSPVPDTLTYCESVYYIDTANANPNVSCIISTPELAGRVVAGKGLVIAARPRAAFYEVHTALDPNSGGQTTRIHPSAIVSPSATIGAGVVISERAVVRGNVTIGDNSFIDAGAVLGAEGILYLRDGDENRRILHRGGVQIGRNVTVLANSVVVRGIFPGMPTLIGDHALVGVSSVIGHEVKLGRNSVVSGNCVIARGASIGVDAWIGTSSMVREYVRVGDRASVKAGSIVVADVADGDEVSGNFATSHTRRMMQYLKDRK
jgi:UDP-3-O-[3-hydroxymyristoyl] glucosamine N-acyltransferase